MNMTARERFLNVLNYRPVDRGVYGMGVGWWPETAQRWQTEGYDPARGHGFVIPPGIKIPISVPQKGESEHE